MCNLRTACNHIALSLSVSLTLSVSPTLCQQVVPPWYSGEHHGGVPELIYTHPPKGHPSAYLHGAPVHESYGPGPGHEHFEGAWENSGPGLGSE